MNAIVKGGVLKINFPEVKAGQALICGIAIACKGDLDSVRSFLPIASAGLHKTRR